MELKKPKTLSFNCFISSSYKVNKSLKAANFKISPSFTLTDRIVEIGGLEDKLNKMSIEASKCFDHVFLNDQEYFLDTKNSCAKNSVTMEDLAQAYFYVLSKKLKGNLDSKAYNTLSSVQIQRGFVNQVSYYVDNSFVLSTAGRFSAVHRHYNLELSDKENKDLYKKCSVDHGHEYKIRVFVKKTLKNKETYKVLNLSELQRLLKEKILDLFHGKYLNNIVGNTSGEILIKYCYSRLKPFIKENFMLELKETRKNSFFYPVNFLDR